MVKISRCMFSFYPIISFTDVCSISESGFNLGRLDRNTDTNDNIPTIDQTVMVWKRTRKSFSVRTGGFSYVYRSLSQKKNYYIVVILIFVLTSSSSHSSPLKSKSVSTIFRIFIILFQIKLLWLRIFII